MGIISMRCKALFGKKNGGGEKSKRLLHYERESRRETAYFYYPGFSEPVLDGAFCYRKAGSIWFLPQTRIEGNYRNNHKDGVWNYLKRQEGIDRKKTRLTVTYRNGIHEGDYKVSIHKRQITSWLNTRLSNDRPIGRMEASIADRRIQGNCDEEGRADGLWTLTEPEGGQRAKRYQEQWSHGKLVESYYVRLKEGRGKHPCEPMILDFISNFIRAECVDLERRFSKGCHSWKGSILCDKGSINS